MKTLHDIALEIARCGIDIRDDRLPHWPRSTIGLRASARLPWRIIRDLEALGYWVEVDGESKSRGYDHNETTFICGCGDGGAEIVASTDDLLALSESIAENGAYAKGQSLYRDKGWARSCGWRHYVYEGVSKRSGLIKVRRVSTSTGRVHKTVQEWPIGHFIPTKRNWAA